MTSARWLDFLYPPSCQLCRSPLQDGKALCSTCSLQLPRIQAPYCERCGLPYDGNISTSFTCPNCRDQNAPYEFAIAALQAQDGARDLIHAFKYQRRIHLHRELALLMAEIFREEGDERLKQNKAWTLVPVPLHRRRKYWRWFNQAEEIARALGEELSLPVLPALKRIRDTPQQTLLSRKDRQKNLKGAFRLSSHEKKHQNLAGKPILLIDDVFTTGSTASECARVLQEEAGAEKVVVLTVLRG